MWRKEASLTSACFKKMEEKHMHDGTGIKGEQLAPVAIQTASAASSSTWSKSFG
jgi:hypothetical protein